MRSPSLRKLHSEIAASNTLNDRATSVEALKKVYQLSGHLSAEVFVSVAILSGRSR